MTTSLNYITFPQPQLPPAQLGYNNLMSNLIDLVWALMKDSLSDLWLKWQVAKSLTIKYMSQESNGTNTLETSILTQTRTGCHHTIDTGYVHER